MTRYAQALNHDLDVYAAFWQIAHEEDTPAITAAPYCYYPRGKQETPEYVEPFNVQADWEERA